MNLAMLVSSLVLAASTATAGLLAAPTLPLLPQGGEKDPSVALGPACVGACGQANGTDLCRGLCGDGTNGTAPGNATSSPEEPQAEPAEASDEPASASASTCGVDIHDSRDVQGPTAAAWSWQVGSGTRNLTVELWIDGVWSPFGGGASALLTDGDGNVVARSDDASGAGLPLGGTHLLYEGSSATGLSLGLWKLEVEADGALGSIWVQVHSAC